MRFFGCSSVDSSRSPSSSRSSILIIRLICAMGTSLAQAPKPQKRSGQSCSRFLWITLLMRGQKSVQSQTGRGFRKSACILRSAAEQEILVVTSKASMTATKHPGGVLPASPHGQLLQYARVPLFYCRPHRDLAPVRRCVKALEETEQRRRALPRRSRIGAWLNFRKTQYE